MENIINFEEARNKRNSNLSTEDIFNLFLIFKNCEQPLAAFDLNILMESLAKYKEMDRFAFLYRNLIITRNANGKDIIDLNCCLNKHVQNKTIIINPLNQSEIMLIGTDTEFNQLKKLYDEKTLLLFSDLMFFITMDFKYGVNNWSLFAEDEYLKYPKYPGIVTGEFIGQEKTPKVMQKVRKIAIDELRNL